MSDVIDINNHLPDAQIATGLIRLRTQPVVVPSNTVYTRVGDEVYCTAHDGVSHNLTPQDIIREIVSKHDVRLSVGELRLLLATRRSPGRKV
jgi:hypothetical protein